MYVLGGIYCNFVWTPEDRRELSKFFLCLPAGFGSYEKLYQKGFWRNTIAERLPFKEKDIDMPTIHFLGKIFFQCANSIAESIRLCVNHQLLTQHESGSSKGKSYVLPTKKFLFPIIFRRVASDNLLTTMGRLCAFQHAKYTVEKISSEDKHCTMRWGLGGPPCVHRCAYLPSPMCCKKHLFIQPFQSYHVLTFGPEASYTPI
jgi:hypothetical protein